MNENMSTENGAQWHLCHKDSNNHLRRNEKEENVVTLSYLNSAHGQPPPRAQ